MDAPQVSTAFPEGEGDLCLISNDGVLFYVHSQLLRHSSPVFATMFEIGGGTGKPEGKSNDSVRMEADSATLELLLLYVYPLRKNPQLETLEQISTLLSLSHRYELDGITQQLRVALTEPRFEGSDLTRPLYKVSPLIALAITDAYGLIPEARLALHDCLSLDQSDLLGISAQINIPFRIITDVLKLRQERVEWFARKLDSLEWPGMTAQSTRHCAIDRSKIEREFNQKPDLHALKNIMLSSSDAGISIATLQGWEKEWSQAFAKLPEFPAKCSKKKKKKLTIAL